VSGNQVSCKFSEREYKDRKGQSSVRTCRLQSIQRNRTRLFVLRICIAYFYVHNPLCLLHWRNAYKSRLQTWNSSFTILQL